MVNHVDGKIGSAKVDWDKLRNTVRIGVRFLDALIDYNKYHNTLNEKVLKNERKIGMGTLGLGEMLIRMGKKYGESSLDFINDLYRFIAVEEYKASIEIAEEKGAFPSFDYDGFIKSGFMKMLLPELPEEYRKKLKDTGIRNVCCSTSAPTGSSGTMVGTSTGIEPYFSFSYYRSGRLGTRKIDEKIVQEYYKENPNAKELPDYFVTASTITPRDHVLVQATIQKWVDGSISKTTNLPNDYTVEQVKEVYELAYEYGCKGVTVYRDGSRDSQVLEAEKKEDAKAEIRCTLKRPSIVYGFTERVKTSSGKIYITANSTEDGIVEVFIAGGEDDTNVSSLCAYIGRLISIARKYNVPLDEIVSQGQKVPGGEPFWYKADGDNKGHMLRNIPSAISFVLSRTLEQGEEEGSNGKKCPSCGGELRIGEGCESCNACGYSKCG